MVPKTGEADRGNRERSPTADTTGTDLCRNQRCVGNLRVHDEFLEELKWGLLRDDVPRAGSPQQACTRGTTSQSSAGFSLRIVEHDPLVSNCGREEEPLLSTLEPFIFLNKFFIIISH